MVHCVVLVAILLISVASTVWHDGEGWLDEETPWPHQNTLTGSHLAVCMHIPQSSHANRLHGQVEGCLAGCPVDHVAILPRMIGVSSKDLFKILI